MNEPKERPLICTPQNVASILTGDKTQSRRVVKPQPEPVHNDAGRIIGWRFIGGVSTPAIDFNLNTSLLVREHVLPRCPYGVPGDRLWLREKWRKGITDGGLAIEYGDNSRVYLQDYPDPSTDWYWLEDMPWKSPLFMPRWASRGVVELTQVRVERIQDISEEDATAEGEVFGCDSVDWFAAAWDSINGKRLGCAWSDNPFVWVLTFRLLAQKEL